MKDDRARRAYQILWALNQACTRQRDEGEDIPDWLDPIEDDAIDLLMQLKGDTLPL